MDEAIALEGAFLIERALAAGLDMLDLYCVPAREAWARLLPGLRIEPRVLPEAGISELAGYRFHRGAYALARRPAARGLDEALGRGSSSMWILALPELSDPENLGAVFRNAAALGGAAVLLGPSGPDPYARRVLRVSMGASLSLPWARLSGPAELRLVRDRGFRTAACVLAPDASDIRRWKAPERLALVLGNEAQGLSEAWLEACSDRITLPMEGGTDSLNVATAAAIMLYATAQGQEASDALAV
jgi:tRNA G18 (ribose-2'-O)-methylase SpoU